MHGTSRPKCRSSEPTAVSPGFGTLPSANTFEAHNVYASLGSYIYTHLLEWQGSHSEGAMPLCLALVPQ